MNWPLYMVECDHDGWCADCITRLDELVRAWLLIEALNVYIAYLQKEESMSTTEHNPETTTKKWDIFMMLLTKAPIMQSLDEDGFAEDGSLTEKGELSTGQMVRDVNAVTDCIWRTLIDINNEAKKQPAKRSSR